MEVRCSLCGKVQKISKIHKDYQRLAGDPGSVFVCTNCSYRVQHQAKQTQKPPKPM